MSAATTAIRIDPEAWIREEIAFFGPGPDYLYGIRHLPLQQEPIGGVVVASPYDTEIPATYRWEVLLGRHLASHGFAVQRFHYRGMGNSDGDIGRLTFCTMVDDALTAAAELERVGIDQPAFAGAGLGSMVGAAASARYPGARLIIRGPQLEGRTYFRQAFRAHVVGFMREDPSGDPLTVDQLQEDLVTQGAIDVCGHTVTREFYDSAWSRTLEAELGSAPRPMLLLQGNPSGKLSKDAQACLERLTDAGFPVDTSVTARLETFWLLGSEFRPVDDLPEMREQLATISDWLTDQVRS